MQLLQVLEKCDWSILFLFLDNITKKLFRIMMRQDDERPYCSGIWVVNDCAKNEIRLIASLPWGKKYPLNPRSPSLIKNAGARRVRLSVFVSERTWWQSNCWTWSIESKCLRYIEWITAFHIWLTNLPWPMTWRRSRAKEDEGTGITDNYTPNGTS